MQGGTRKLSTAEIHETRSAADQLNQRGNSLQAFILALMGWECNNYEFVLAALQMQGLDQVSTKGALRTLNYQQFTNMNRIWNRPLRDEPTATESVTPVWQQREFKRHKHTYREGRHGLVLGGASADPRILRRGVELICDSLKPVELLESLRVRI